MNLFFKILAKIELKSFLKLFTILFLIANINQVAKSQERARWIEIKTDIHPKGRAGACMAQFESGKVLMFGGEDVEGNFLNDTWLFELETGEWTRIMTNNSPNSRFGSKMVKIDDGKIILIGGWTDNQIENNDLWIFDFKLMDWIVINPIGICERRTKHSIVRLSNGKVLIYGGDYLDADIYWGEPYVRIYDIKTNQWGKVLVDYFNEPNGFSGGELVNIKDNIVLYFGGERFGKENNTVKIFNFNNEEGFRWSKNISKNYTHARDQFGIAKLDQNIVVFGGYAYNFIDSIQLPRCNDSWLYNIEESNWKELIFNLKPDRRYLHSMCELTKNKAVLFGGLGPSDQFYENTWIFEYDSLVSEVKINDKDENKKINLIKLNSNQYKIEGVDLFDFKIEIVNNLGQLIPLEILKRDFVSIDIQISNISEQVLFFNVFSNKKNQSFIVLGDFVCKK